MAFFSANCATAKIHARARLKRALGAGLSEGLRRITECCFATSKAGPRQILQRSLLQLRATIASTTPWLACSRSGRCRDTSKPCGRGLSVGERIRGGISRSFFTARPTSHHCMGKFGSGEKPRGLV
jgi:hypothetical protein